MCHFVAVISLDDCKLWNWVYLRVNYGFSIKSFFCYNYVNGFVVDRKNLFIIEIEQDLVDFGIECIFVCDLESCDLEHHLDMTLYFV